MEISVLKSEFSNTVVRKALYWISENATWNIKDTDEKYIIDIKPIKKSDEYMIEDDFHRLLNDFYLREQIDKSNKDLRKEIIKQALTKVYLHNV